MSDKPTNPKDLIGSNKVPFHLWPLHVTALGVLALLEGALKYGRLNWRATGVRASVYFDAMLRHMACWFEGEEKARDSQVDHLGHALACLAIIIDAREVGMLVDDRNFLGPDVHARFAALAADVARLRETHADRDVKHYTIADNTDFTVLAGEVPTPRIAERAPEQAELPTIYIAGPMTGRAGFNYPAFDAAAAVWRGRGWAVHSPADITRAFWLRTYATPFDPFVTDAAELARIHGHYADFLRMDLQALAQVQAIAVLPDWIYSRGARFEVRTALLLGLPVYDAMTFDELLPDVAEIFAMESMPA